ncbi:MAG: redoxin domain-containing protein [Planctomycetia bacterium]|nr:redoxin domain-containing protein [Planctomycetia bacterium]
MRIVSDSGSQAPAWEPTAHPAPPAVRGRASRSARSLAGAWERVACVIVMLLTACPVLAEDSPSPAAKQFTALVDEYENEGGATIFAKRFLALAEDHPQDPAGAEAMLWVVENVRGRSETTKALELMQANHLDSERLGSACGNIARSRSLAAEKLLRALLEKSPHAEVKAQACYYLALLLDSEAVVIDQLRAEPDLAPRVLQYYGKDYGEHLASLNADELARQREQVYETMLNSFPDVTAQDTPLGKVAERALFGIRQLSVGRIAPEIEGEDIHGDKFKLSDFRGKVVMLTFWGHW